MSAINVNESTTTIATFVNIQPDRRHFNKNTATRACRNSEFNARSRSCINILNTFTKQYKKTQHNSQDVCVCVRAAYMQTYISSFSNAKRAKRLRCDGANPKYQTRAQPILNAVRVDFHSARARCIS